MKKVGTDNVQQIPQRDCLPCRKGPGVGWGRHGGIYHSHCGLTPENSPGSPLTTHAFISCSHEVVLCHLDHLPSEDMSEDVQEKSV